MSRTLKRSRKMRKTHKKSMRKGSRRMRKSYRRSMRGGVVGSVNNAAARNPASIINNIKYPDTMIPIPHFSK